MKIKPSSAKAKGRRLQNYVCQVLSEITGIPWGKDELIAPREMGQSGPDIRLIGEARKLINIAFECKNEEKWKVPEYIRQAKEQKWDDVDHWTVVVSKNRQKIPYVIIDMDFFKELLKLYVDSRR